MLRVLAAATLAATCAAAGLSGPAGAGSEVVRAKPAGSVRIVFRGQGQETVQDVQRHVTVSENTCNQRETLTATVSLHWTVSWGKVRVAALHAAAGAPTLPGQVGASLGAERVRDGCDRPDQTPPDWPGSERCDDQLVPVDQGSLYGARGAGAKTVRLEITAPGFALPEGARCPVNIRSDQYVAHVSVSRQALARLKRGRSISVRVGTARPGPGDFYQSRLNCSQSPKPYDNYRLLDSCTDQLSWSGTLTLTKL
jgi:hypothetical protein